MNFKDRYKYNSVTDLLGSGGFSTVFLATDTLLNRKVALKFFPASSAKKYSIIEEIRKVIGLEHRNIARYYDAAIIEVPDMHGGTENVEVGIMEYLEGGDIRTYLKKYNNDPLLLKKLLVDVLEGLSYLHSNQIIHRDLKPDNILIAITPGGPVAKIIDFGISKNLGGSQKSSSAILGSIEYMAPEQFNPARYGRNGKITTNVDLWSFGVMVYELLSGSQLFGTRSTGDTSEQVMNNILQKQIADDFNAIQEPWRTTIGRCLERSAEKRAQTGAELLGIIARTTGHPVVSGNEGTHRIEKMDNRQAKENQQSPRLIEVQTEVYGKAFLKTDNKKIETTVQEASHLDREMHTQHSEEHKTKSSDSSRIPLRTKRIVLGLLGGFVIMIIVLVYLNTIRDSEDQTDVAQDTALVARQRDSISEYMRMGMEATMSDKRDVALENYLSALQLSEEIFDTVDMARAYSNIGLIHSNYGNYQLAIVNFNAAFDLFELKNDSVGIGHVYNNIAKVHQLNGDYISSLSYFEKALAINEHLENPVMIGECYLGVGQSNALLGRVDPAEDNLLKAESVFESIGHFEGQKEVYIALQTLYSSQSAKMPPQKYHELYSKFGDSITVNP